MTTEPSLALNDHEFLSQLEACLLNPIYFDHIGHLRLAWLSLQQNELEAAVEKTCICIKNFAESLGAYDKFHYTLTDAIVRVMHGRWLQDEGFDDFLKRNPNLFSKLIEAWFSGSVIANICFRSKTAEA